MERRQQKKLIGQKQEDQLEVEALHNQAGEEGDADEFHLTELPSYMQVASI